MKTQITSIGNSKGIRIPKSFLDQLKFKDEVELSIKGDHLTISPLKEPRQNWSAQFTQNNISVESEIQDLQLPANEFDDLEWQWE